MREVTSQTIIECNDDLLDVMQRLEDLVEGGMTPRDRLPWVAQNIRQATSLLAEVAGELDKLRRGRR